MKMNLRISQKEYDSISKAVAFYNVSIVDFIKSAIKKYKNNSVELLDLSKCSTYNGNVINIEKSELATIEIRAIIQWYIYDQYQKLKAYKTSKLTLESSKNGYEIVEI